VRQRRKIALLLTLADGDIVLLELLGSRCRDIADKDAKAERENKGKGGGEQEERRAAKKILKRQSWCSYL
jgi:hypothetical protein